MLLVCSPSLLKILEFIKKKAGNHKYGAIWLYFFLGGGGRNLNWGIWWEYC